MFEQFAIFKNLHAQTCTVSWAKCDHALGSFADYLWFIVIAAAIAAFVASGLAAQLGRFVERKTAHLWQQTLIFSTGIVSLYLIGRAGQHAWAFAQAPVQEMCQRQKNHPSAGLECLGGQRSIWDATIEGLTGGLWLIPVVALILWVAIKILRRAPQRLWLLPALFLIGFVSVSAIIGPWHARSSPLAADSALARDIAPMVRKNGWSMEQVHLSSEGSFVGPARVIGLGPLRRIELGIRYLYDKNSIPIKFVSNGYLTPYPSPAVTRAIIGHELAHIRRWHQELQLTATILLIASLCWVLARGLTRSRFGDNPWAVLPLYAAALIICVPLHDAAADGLTLVTEYDADRAGLDISREPDGFAEFALLQAAGGPLELPLKARWLMTQHPSDGDRIRQSIDWQERNRPQTPLAIPNLKALLVPANQPNHKLQ